MRLAREVLYSGDADPLLSQSKDTLAQILETRNDIFKIERSMREIKYLLSGLPVLVTD